jgi:hypothetical protein
MTYRYGEDNNKKRGARWLLTHCAFCGDPHQVFPYGAHRTALTTLCECSEGTQRARRYVREHQAELAAAAAARPPEPFARPDRRDRDTQLGA